MVQGRFATPLHKKVWMRHNKLRARAFRAGKLKRGFFNLFKQKAVGAAMRQTGTSSSSSMWKKGALAAAAAGTIAAGVGAYNYVYGSKSGKKRRTSESGVQRKGRRYNSAFGRTVGKYNRVSKFKGLLDFNKKGVVIKLRKVEEVGNLNGLYQLIPTLDMEYVFQAVSCAIIKSLCEKAGMRVSALDQPLLTYSPATDSGSSNNNYAFQLFSTDATDGSTDLADTRNVIAGDSVYSIGTWLKGFLKSWSAGYGENNIGNAVSYTKIKLYSFYTTTVWPVAEIYLDEVMVDVFGECKTIVQNRSAANVGPEDDEDEGSAENVANHPVKGIIYKFKGVPRVKNVFIVAGTTGNNGNDFESIEVDGDQPAKTINLDPDEHNYGVDLVQPRQFYNCIGSSFITHEPGDIKTYKDSYRNQMGLVSLLKAMRFQNSTVTAKRISTFSIFPTMMFGYTSLINVRRTNIDLAFEMDKSIAVIISQKKRKYCTEYKIR